MSTSIVASPREQNVCYSALAVRMNGNKDGSKEWMRRAIALAMENVQLGRGGPFGAVVVKDEQLIAEGVNLVTANNDPSAHAEIVAIRAACTKLNAHQLTACVLYSSCEPCPMCLGAIYWARPERFYYACTRQHAAEAGFDDEFIYREIGLAPEQRSVPGECLLADEGFEPFLQWSTSQSKRPY